MLEGSPSATSFLRESLSSGQYRNSGDNFRRLLEDPFVVQLLTENELMLTEIEVLRRQLRESRDEVRQLQAFRDDGEVKAIRDAEAMLMKSDDQVNEARERDEKKVSLLRPILDSLVRLHFSAPYLTAPTRSDEESQRSDEHTAERSGSIRDSQLSAAPQPQPPMLATPRLFLTPPCASQQCSSSDTRTSARESRSTTGSLEEANAHFVQLYRLVSSYQSTPSFMSSPYDGLVLDAFAHIICLSKSMNALVFANAERDSDFVMVPQGIPVESLSRQETPRLSERRASQSLWGSLTKKFNPNSRPGSRQNSRPTTPAPAPAEQS